MAKNLLTELKVKNILIKDDEYFISDGDRLYLRIKPTGHKDWYFIYSSGSKRPKIVIGKYPLISLEEARRKADYFRKLIADGHDLKEFFALEKNADELRKMNEQIELQAKLNRLTVLDLYDRWEKQVLRFRKDGGRELRRIFEKDIAPVIGSLPAEEVKKSDIVKIINRILDRDANRMAKVILSTIRQMFTFAIDQDILESDPSATIRKSKIGGKDVVRDRILSESEIIELGKALPNANLLISSECAIWLMLSTLCRISEICKAEWKHLDLENKTWKIPKENSKNGREHTIYLSEFSVNQFKRLLTIKSSDRWIYPNKDNTSHVLVKSISKQVGDRQLSDDRNTMSNRSKLKDSLKLTGGKWTPHDLRRTGATMMGNLGELSDVIEKCLNHTEQNRMIKTYQHQKLISEQKRAWNLLGKRLDTLLNRELINVVFLQKKNSQNN